MKISAVGRPSGATASSNTAPALIRECRDRSAIFAVHQLLKLVSSFVKRGSLPRALASSICDLRRYTKCAMQQHYGESPVLVFRAPRSVLRLTADRMLNTVSRGAPS